MTTLGISLMRRAAILAPLTLAAAGVVAQEGTPVRVHGQITSVNGKQVTVQTQEGSAVRLELSPDAKVMAMVPGKAEAVSDRATIGAAAVKQPDGRLQAKALVIYPEGDVGSGEGYFTWNLTPDSMMVQGEVRSVQSGADGQVIEVYYPQAGATLVVPSGTPVVTLEAADMSLVKQGAYVVVPNAEKGSGDTLTAELVAVGKNGYVPPL